LRNVRFCPITPRRAEEDELDRLNEERLERLQRDGEVFVSNGVIDGLFFLRACIVNFRTTEDHIRALPEVVYTGGREVHRSGAGAVSRAGC
jgi:hypothetical protein